MILTTPVHGALAPRQTDPLESLISMGIQAGNSLLSEVLGTHTSPTASFTTFSSWSTTYPTSSWSETASSSSPQVSASTPTSLAPTTSSLPTTSPLSTSGTTTTSSAASSSPVSLSSSTPSSSLAGTPSSATAALFTTAPATATAAVVSNVSQSSAGISSSHGGGNKTLATALGVVFGLLALALLIFGIWFLRRRAKGRRAMASFEKVYRPSEDGGLHATSDWECTAPLPAPKLPVLRSYSIRSTRYEPLTPISPITRQGSVLQNPFLSPEETRLEKPQATKHNSIVSQSSVESERILPVTLAPVESPAVVPSEIEGDAGTLLQRQGSVHQSRAIWPSRADSMKFDFGFDNDARPARRDMKAFGVPRRPVGGYRRP